MEWYICIDIPQQLISYRSLTAWQTVCHPFDNYTAIMALKRISEWLPKFRKLTTISCDKLQKQLGNECAAGSSCVNVIKAPSTGRSIPLDIAPVLLEIFLIERQGSLTMLLEVHLVLGKQSHSNSISITILNGFHLVMWFYTTIHCSFSHIQLIHFVSNNLLSRQRFNAMVDWSHNHFYYILFQDRLKQKNQEKQTCLY